MAPIIEASGLTKHYGEVHALDGLDLVAESGRVTALLGPNGAGKTTAIRMLATLLRPDAGEAQMLGRCRYREHLVEINSDNPAYSAKRHHRYQARNSRNRPEVQVTEGAAHVTQSWSTCSDGDDHASRDGEKQ